MRLLLIFIFNLFIFISLPALQVYAQTDEDTEVVEEEADTDEKKEEPVKKNTKFIQGLELSVDYLKLTSHLVSYENKAEGGLGILFRKNIFLAFEGGYGELQPRKAYINSNYQSTGYYGRVGLDYVINFDAKNNIFFGARYGQSHFEDKADWTIGSELWKGYSESFHRQNLVAHFSELVFGSEAKYKGNLYYGFIFRFRMLHKYDKFEPVDVFSIPGYGRTSDKTIPAFNLFVKYKLGF
jgi:hypothetical protein